MKYQDILNIFKSKYITNDHTVDQTKLVHMLQQHEVDHVLDVGAHFGEYASAIRDAGYRGKITSFEPMQAAHEFISKKCERDSTWEVASRMALGDRNEDEVTLHIAEDSKFNSILNVEKDMLRALPKSRFKGEEVMKMRRMDSLFDNITSYSKNIFLKVNVQGAEKMVLEGAAKHLDHYTGLQLELSLFPRYEDELVYDDVAMWVRDAGFEPYLITPGHFSRRVGRLMNVNVVFFMRRF